MGLEILGLWDSKSARSVEDGTRIQLTFSSLVTPLVFNLTSFQVIQRTNARNISCVKKGTNRRAVSFQTRRPRNTSSKLQETKSTRFERRNERETPEALKAQAWD